MQIFILLSLPNPSFAIFFNVLQGEIEKEKFDSYHAPFYAPSKDEIEELVKKNSSFQLHKLEMFQIEKKHHADNQISYGTAIAKTVRAIQEPMLIHHFGIGEGALHTLFEAYGRLVDEEMAKEEIKPVTFSLVLRKLFMGEQQMLRSC